MNCGLIAGSKKTLAKKNGLLNEVGQGVENMLAALQNHEKSGVENFCCVPAETIEACAVFRNGDKNFCQ